MKFSVCVFLSAAIWGSAMSNAATADDQSAYSSAFNEQYRPRIHFTPPSNWMNDPNGMFYLDGEYHLFYQHNPEATVWGPMHWGHAVSKDLVHWEHLPIALYPDEHGTVFSGSAVVDWQNTSGLGTKENPPIVALYTYHNAKGEQQGRIDYQTQAMAYSTDKGRTWTKYEGNPVINNPGIEDFRDPKVMWHEASGKWVMALAQKDHIGFYSSADLKQWKAESTFGHQYGNHDGVWECPELLFMPVGDSGEMRYVLLVSISPGGPNGGSATQYFVGDFDGKTFSLDPDWQALLAQTPAKFPKGEVFDDFEGSMTGWQAEGTAFLKEPTQGAHTNQRQPVGHVGKHLINSFVDGDKATGSLTSPEFTIQSDFINFKIGGGQFSDRVGMQLLVDGKVVKTATGKNRGVLINESWDVSAFKGQLASIRIIDFESGGWGHTLIDHIVFADKPATTRIEPAEWLDYGTDNYAGVTFFTTPDSNESRQVFMGWMSNWLYANDVPTTEWRSAMTMPRTLHLVSTKVGLRLQSKLVAEVEKLVSEKVYTAKLDGGNTLALDLSDDALSDSAVQFTFTVKPDEQRSVEVEFRNKQGQAVSLRIDPFAKKVMLDRSRSGEVDFYGGFSKPQYAALNTFSDTYSVTVVADHSSVEVFIDDGLTVMSSLVFPDTVFTELKNKEAGSAIFNAEVSQLRSIWK